MVPMRPAKNVLTNKRIFCKKVVVAPPGTTYNWNKVRLVTLDFKQLQRIDNEENLPHL